MHKRTQVLSAIDNIALADSHLQGRRLALLTNHTGINRGLQSSIDILHKRYGLSALIACEHGIRGDIQAGELLEDARDQATGLPVHSIYGKAGKQLTDYALAAFDVLIVDLQDVGLRFYTYLYSVGYALASCARANKQVVVLDRINPLGGEKVQGTVLDPAFASFVGDYALPTRYGLTLGELALYVKHYLQLDVDLHIIPLSGWQRQLYLDDTDTPWPPPSPNCPHLSTILCYQGTCILEGTNLSEGRGTTLPFEMVGAPYINAQALTGQMTKLRLPGLGFTPAYFSPSFSKHQGQACQGVMLHIRDRQQADPLLASLCLLETVQSLYPGEFAYLPPYEGVFFFDRLLGTDAFRSGKLKAEGLLQAHQPRVAAFARDCMQFHLY